jgi:CRISPR-associated DxTHG motif protein
MAIVYARTTHREAHFTGSATVRDVVIGMSDGLTVPFALAAGLSGAVSDSGGPRLAPSTPGDLLFHIRAERVDMCCELGAQIMARLVRDVDVVDETHGFRYLTTVT